MSKRAKNALPLETLKMLDLGMRLIPVASKGKHPLLKGWPEKATTDREQIALWAQQFPACNWGIATGHESGCFVVDVDGEAGKQTINAWKEEHGADWMQTLTSKTGKGLHLFFQCAAGKEIGNSASQIAPGIDIRGEGGHVVAPGSTHKSGVIYSIEDSSPVAEAPSWLMDLILEGGSAIKPKSGGAAQVALSLPSVRQTQAEVREGGRNSALTSLVGTMRQQAMSRETLSVLAVHRSNRVLPTSPVALLAPSDASNEQGK